MAMKLVILAAGAVVASATSSASAQNLAVKWLSAHPAEYKNQDELAELQSANPEAYAIVKALLTKRSLGLLDPKHPTASFAAPPPSADQPKLSGAAAFANLVTPEELANVGKGSKVVEAYPDMPAAPAAPVHHGDWLNWKPQNSATDDDAMVANVLGAVATIKGKSGSAVPVHDDSGSSLANDEDLLGASAPSVADVAPQAASTPPVVDVASAPLVADEAPQAASASVVAYEAPEAASAPLVADEPPLSASATLGANQLNLAARPSLRLATVRKNAPTSSAESTLDSWLGGQASPSKAAAEPAAAAPTENPYTVGLW